MPVGLSGNPELDDRAGEYALGVLEGAERREAEIALARDAAFAAAVAWWEERFYPLVSLMPEAVPPAELWPRIEAATGGTVVPFPAKNGALAAWRAAAIGAGAIAAALAAFLWFRPAPEPQVAALLPLAGAQTGWIASVAGGRVVLRPLPGLTLAADRSYELWSLPEGAKAPVPLGLLAAGAEATISRAKLPASGRLKLLVSLEPRGGSPTGLPTGPVLFGADILLR